ncbi:MAG: 2,3-bisphosphoglycerate-independent phosphoglycerate mutase [Candidatus Atribacteria bacterium]|nr:2,3-bisphosphoglycerate-independent phosphoglycerate mutase [Candidatus Atribacteria bacterium]MBE3091490.1 2,3-bisphosphoglycerate-independent phosphoglycerate mutase [Candidatus Atribacteria bacterium]MBE3113586.1 2,3-bisphosphoglycerate-independent phosphoglycerate mutase [Actinomycetota bacterium]MBE3127732.1 2,3-bisphosphoglycerate-independent phosphoglycerate mutase [Candidatus Atribacteria bacterium]
MVNEEIMKSLAIKTESKIVLLVADGIGDLPSENNKTVLERAFIPNLDKLASKSVCGLTDPISCGITPGSGPAHLSLFGYDPIKYQIGRGVLEALGIGMELTSRDLACRGNFATLDKEGIITDRRAGRIATELNEKLCKLMQGKINQIGEVEIIIKPGKEHRFVVIFRGDGLEEALSDADPQKVGEKIKFAEPLDSKAKKSVKTVNEFIKQATEVLKEHYPANTVLLRGFAKYPGLPTMEELFKLTPAAIATYPMYKGLAKLVGMDILETGESLSDEFKTLQDNFSRYDFFYLHIKKTDSYGEDGNFEQKVKVIEEVDKFIPNVLALKPDVLVVTGDHSTPAIMKGHSWHPNPFMLFSKYIRVDEAEQFNEKECVKGGLGRFSAVDVLPLMMANALKLQKFGA